MYLGPSSVTLATSTSSRDDEKRSEAADDYLFVVKLSARFLLLSLLASLALGYVAGVVVRPSLVPLVESHMHDTFDKYRRSSYDAAYYEALVHPAMLTHRSQRIGVLSSANAANRDNLGVLAEVVKHKTVQETTRIQQLEQSCLIGDEKQGGGALAAPRNQTDVLIVDSWRSLEEFGWSSSTFEILYESLAKDGLLVIPMPNSLLSVPFLELVERLKGVGFESIQVYEEASFLFVVAMKDYKSRARWLSNEAQVNLAIRQRIMGGSLLEHFDGATMRTFVFPSRVVENLWCQLSSDPRCKYGHGYDPQVLNYSEENFEVRKSRVAEMAGRGVFATSTIPGNVYVAMESCVYSMFVPPSTIALMYKLEEEFGEEVPYFYTFVDGYLDGYGFDEPLYGEPSVIVDPSICTFVNHGCNGTYNLGMPYNVTELTVVENLGPLANGFPVFDDMDAFDPFLDRRYPPTRCDDIKTRRAILPGEELLDNYLGFGGIDFWEENVRELKALCSGADVGDVIKYETAAAMKK